MNVIDRLIEARAAQAVAEVRALAETARRSIGQRTRRKVARWSSEQITEINRKADQLLAKMVPLPKVRAHDPDR